MLHPYRHNFFKYPRASGGFTAQTPPEGSFLDYTNGRTVVPWVPPSTRERFACSKHLQGPTVLHIGVPQRRNSLSPILRSLAMPLITKELSHIFARSDATCSYRSLTWRKVFSNHNSQTVGRVKQKRNFIVSSTVSFNCSIRNFLTLPHKWLCAGLLVDVIQ